MGILGVDGTKWNVGVMVSRFDPGESSSSSNVSMSAGRCIVASREGPRKEEELGKDARAWNGKAEEVEERRKEG